VRGDAGVLADAHAQPRPVHAHGLRPVAGGVGVKLVAAEMALAVHDASAVCVDPQRGDEASAVLHDRRTDQGNRLPLRACLRDPSQRR